MSRGSAGAGILLTLLAGACGGRKDEGKRQLPPGDAVWLSAGLSGSEGETEKLLRHGAFARVFLPVLRVSMPGGSFRVESLTLPASPLDSTPVILLVQAAGDFGAAFVPGSEEALSATLGDALSRVLQERAKIGKVEGVHFDLPFAPGAAEAFEAFTERIRARLPLDLFLTSTLGFVPPEKEREELLRRLSPLDGVAVFVFGGGAVADPIAADALGKPWWAGYRPGATGGWFNAAGVARGTMPEGDLDGLTENSAVAVEHDLEIRQEGVDGFVLRPSSPVTIRGMQLERGDRIAFQRPAVSELLYRLGSDLAGRRNVRGRLVVLDGVSEADRLLTLSALSDILLGRPLLPEFRVSLSTDGGVLVSAENLTTHTSVLSRTANWVEVDVPGGQIRDVHPGGFDRYEVFDAEGRPVTPGRATRVRFFETLIAPRERIAPASIVLRASPPPGCCRFRQHVLAESGNEMAGDWIAPPPPPTPVPKPTAKAKPKRR